ncbi:MAG TPA: glycosyltransferase family 9 protein [Bryobacteraceae bacterium]|nr:glycosyltransferase family 9 protein [Bryobacteraceae bacterium]
MRTLLIRPGAIGDCIRHFPDLEALRSDYTEVWTPRAVVPLVRFADRVRPLAETRIDVAGLPGFPLPEEWNGFDRIHSWYGTNRPEFREAVAHLPFTFHPAIPIAPPVAVPSIPIRGRRHNRVILHPFSGSARKNWPLASFQELARLLGDAAWTCGPEEELPDAVRFADLAQLAEWIAGAPLYIGNDSGITHLAAAVGTPTLALFGPTDPAIWCPAGTHVRWMRFAEPAAVFAVASQLLR